MEAKGILVLGDDLLTSTRAKTAKLAVKTGDAPAVPFEKTVIVKAGTRVPFDLLPAAWNILDKWDAAVPLWRSGVTAAEVGQPEERERTQALALDLRVPLHTVELLFVRAGGAGEDLVTAWVEEQADGGDARLAFLRALHQVKPRLCLLPNTWLAEVRTHENIRSSRRPGTAVTVRPLVRLEVAPGRFVNVHSGDEEKALEHFRRTQSARR